MNAGNYGLSVNLFAFGQSGLARASIYFAGTAVLGSSLGVYLSARGRAPVGLALRRMAGVPLVYAAALGLALNLGGLTLPEPVGKAIHLLGQASVPVMLSVLGIKLADTFQSRKQALHLPAVGVVTVVRLIVAPALTWLIAGALGLQGLSRSVVVVESAMPTAVITTILATEFESDPSFSALCVLVTTLVSLPTVTLVLNLL
jgi:predicted permease